MDLNGETAVGSSTPKVWPKKIIYKNLVIIGLVSLLNFSAIAPTVSLMTSVAGRTLGNLTYGMSYFFTCLFSFLSVPLLSNFASRKKLVLFGVACIIGFIACNWYTSYYTLIPGAVLFGIGTPVVWMTSLVYVKELAVYYAKNSAQKDTNIASYFTGILIAFSVIGYLVGNATTAGILTILKSDRINNNETDTDQNDNFTKSSKECQTNDDGLQFDSLTTNTLRGIILFYPILSLMTVVGFLNDLEKQQHQITIGLNVLSTATKQVWLSAISVAKSFVQKKMLMSCPLFFTSGLGIGFIYTSYTKTYVAECVGVHAVGYTIMIYGLGTSLGSVAGGKLLALEAKFQVVLAALTLHLTILLFLIIWEREPLLPILLTIPFLCGICDGTWMTVCSSFVATSFGENPEHSIAVYRIVFQFGIGFNSLLALVVLTDVQLIILSVMYAASAPLYLTVICLSSVQSTLKDVLENLHGNI
ncbi:protein unc-93 homolog A-like isoform X2 [Dysidea avara]|uniref:protein unc-93 homolog A-like isoform X2 n=1 Tax=Dysidea avara TaxID=196820 RepID=UPI00332F3033